MTFKRTAIVAHAVQRMPLLIGLNPSPVAPATPWYEGANATGALAYLAFDQPQEPGVCRRHFDLRNLNDQIVDKDKISRIDPLEAMEKLAAWGNEEVSARPVIACGKTVALMVRAFRSASGVSGGRVIEIPHPACLWRKGGRVPVERWAQARIALRRTLDLPPLPAVDDYGIDNALCGFAHHVDYLHQRQLIEADALNDVFPNEDDDGWDEEVRYWRHVAHAEQEEGRRERLEHAERLTSEGSYYD